MCGTFNAMEINDGVAALSLAPSDGLRRVILISPAMHSVCGHERSFLFLQNAGTISVIYSLALVLIFLNGQHLCVSAFARLFRRQLERRW